MNPSEVLGDAYFDVLTPQDVADIARISVRKVRGLVKSKILRAMKEGRDLRFLRGMVMEDLQRWAATELDQASGSRNVVNITMPAGPSPTGQDQIKNPLLQSVLSRPNGGTPNSS